MKYGLDTNTISYWIQGDNKVASNLLKALRQRSAIIIPPTTYYEIRRGFKHKNSPKKENAFNLMCKSYQIGEMNLAAWEEAAEIYAKTRKDGHPIDDTDILIAAFCIVNGCTLVTNNIKHFNVISGLKVVNWTK